MICTLIGAYGRQDKNEESAKADWEAGKDFRVVNGSYCSVRDKETFREHGVTEIQICTLDWRVLHRVAL